jgi:hypothetical protein
MPEADAARIPAPASDVHDRGYIAYEADHVRSDRSAFPVATEVFAARCDDSALLFRIGDVLVAADIATYDAKGAGGDRICVGVPTRPPLLDSTRPPPWCSG